MNIKLTIPIAILVLVLMGWWLWPSGADRGDNRIDSAVIDRGEVVQIVSSVGSVRALNTVEVGSQLSGQVAELHADFNSQVQAGELLARIDPQTFERRYQEAEANLAVAMANVTVQQAGIQKAEAFLVNARREFERQSDLVQRGSVSAAARDSAEAAWRSAEADLAIARANLINARATVRQREAGRDGARIDLERTEIRSPINGVVIERAVDEGQTVAASLSAPVLFTIAQDLAEIRIEASVDEADIGSVREGASASFTVDAFPGQNFAGRVSQVRLAPNELQNVITYTVIVEAANPGRRLLPGMTASVDIVTGRREDVLRVSNAAARFRPPEFVTVHAESGAPSGPGRGGQGPGAEMAEVLSEMGVSESVREQIRAETSEVFASLRGMMAGGADPSQREQMRSRIAQMMDEILARNLSQTQLDELRQRQAEREETRAATLYLARSDGSLEARPVRLGLSDDRNTEIVSGTVEQGDEVVTRVRRIEAN